MRPAAVVKAKVSGNTRPGLAGAAVDVQVDLFVLDGFSAPRHEHLIAPAQPLPSMRIRRSAAAARESLIKSNVEA